MLSEHRVVIVVSGTFRQFIEWVTNDLKDEAFLDELRILPSIESATSFLGWCPTRATVSRTSVSLAAAAYSHAIRLNKSYEVSIGVGCVAKREEHMIHGEHDQYSISIWASQKTTSYLLRLLKNRRSDEQENSLIRHFYLFALGFLKEQPEGILQDESITITHHPGGASINQLMVGLVDSILVYDEYTLISDEPIQAVLFPYQLIRKGYEHHKLIKQIESQTGLPVVYEIPTFAESRSLFSIDEVKSALSGLKQYGRRIILTRESNYLKKISLFPESIFVVDSLTAHHLIEKVQFNKQLIKLETPRRCRFIIIPNSTHNSKSPQSVLIPPHMQWLFTNL